MEREFFSYYSDNLSYIRRLGAEFAREFPNVAARLDLNAIECQDPFIERLLEGAAFLGARVENQMDRGYSRFLEAILYASCPAVLAPVPAFCSAAIAKQDLSKIQNGSFRVAPGSRFSKTTAESTTPVVFENFFETEIHALSIGDLRVSDHDSEIADLTEEGYRNALTLVLHAEGSGTLGSIAPDYLDLYINMTAQDASALSEYFLTALRGVFLRLADGSYRRLDGITMELAVLDATENALSREALSVSGISILSIYMNYPDVMKYLRIRGLKNAFQDISSHEASLVFIFSREHGFRQDARLTRDALLLNVIPLINLFRHRSSRTFLNREHEINLNVDSTRQTDYEVFYVERTDFFDSSGLPLFQAYPFFSAHAAPASGDEYRNFFTVNRRPRMSAQERSGVRAYKKHEAFLTFSGKDYLENMHQKIQFSAECLVTNADLPSGLSLGNRLNTQSLGKIHSADIITTVTRPRIPLVHAGSPSDFRRLSFIMCNFAAVIAGGEENLLRNLKDLISVFSLRTEEETGRLKSSILDIRISNRVYRFISRGVVFFEQGYQIKLTLRQRDLDGAGFFTFSKVLASLIMTYRDINIPLTIDICSDERGLIYSCKSLTD
ncbi:type VI secretion system baseplate subunit TssF [Succinimonas amylolytica]|uniref:type VI secretion system baseplate subunit TssF n=1 Tax=Succinimonas amylolytica TaxID=83769 RepID=UPI000361151B|nr:type VI secretion system baseplate subunit TssF [Succinimonas amylolytica]